MHYKVLLLTVIYTSYTITYSTRKFCYHWQTVQCSCAICNSVAEPLLKSQPPPHICYQTKLGCQHQRIWE